MSSAFVVVFQKVLTARQISALPFEPRCRQYWGVLVEKTSLQRVRSTVIIGTMLKDFMMQLNFDVVELNPDDP